jgi:ParB family transcriptional regulator, chromosome partitioning protein
VKRGIVRDCLTGENGRAKVEGWVPKWMAFPPAAYTVRAGVPTVARAEKMASLAITPEPLPLRAAALPMLAVPAPPASSFEGDLS